MHFCVYPEHDLLNIHHSEKHFKQKLYSRIIHTSYVTIKYIFCKSEVNEQGEH
jgi:hypothetical protein